MATGRAFMDIILHLGAHRTGTTALHSYLRGNRAALARLKLALWDPEVLHRGLAAGMMGPPGPSNPAQKARIARSVGRIGVRLAQMERDGIDRLLICDPAMIGSLQENLVQSRLYPALLPRLARFGDVLGPRCSRVVLVIRSYDDYWASAIAEAVPMGLPMPDDARLERLVTQPRRWHRVAAEIATVFPRAECLVCPYETIDGRLDLLLAETLGEPFPLFPGAAQRLHKRPSRDMLHQVMADRRIPLAAAGSGTTPWQPFQPWHIEVLQAQYAEDLDWLARGGDGRVQLMAGAAPQGGRDDRPGKQAAGMG